MLSFLETLVSAQALAIFQPSFSGTVVGAIGECLDSRSMTVTIP